MDTCEITKELTFYASTNKWYCTIFSADPSLHRSFLVGDSHRNKEKAVALAEARAKEYLASLIDQKNARDRMVVTEEVLSL